MAPTLRHGDALLVRRGGRPVRPGDVVVAVFRVPPGPARWSSARSARRAGGWWLRGDNDLVTDDSRAYGVADVLGRVVVRYWPRPRRFTGYRAGMTLLTVGADRPALCSAGLPG